MDSGGICGAKAQLKAQGVVACAGRELVAVCLLQIVVISQLPVNKVYLLKVVCAHCGDGKQAVGAGPEAKGHYGVLRGLPMKADAVGCFSCQAV